MTAVAIRQKKIFICYRHDDSGSAVAHLYEHLNEEYRDEVFIDEDSIPGRDFREELDAQVAGCALMLVVIGRRWLEGGASGQRRIDDEGSDYVFREIKAALRRDIPVVPVLVEGARMPTRDDCLPADICALVYRTGVEIRNGKKFHSDFMLLTERIRKDLPISPRRAARSLRAKVRPMMEIIGWLVVATMILILSMAIVLFLAPMTSQEWDEFFKKKPAIHRSSQFRPTSQSSSTRSP